MHMGVTLNLQPLDKSLSRGALSQAMDFSAKLILLRRDVGFKSTESLFE